MAAKLEEVLKALQDNKVVSIGTITGSTYDDNTLVGIAINLDNGDDVSIYDEGRMGTGDTGIKMYIYKKQ